MFTQEEKDFLRTVLSKLSVSLADPESVRSVSIAQSVLAKLNTPDGVGAKIPVKVGEAPKE